MARTRRTNICVPEKPIERRFFAAASWLVLLAAGAAGAEPQPLSEEDLVTRVLTRAPVRSALEGPVRIELGEAASVSAYPNPELSYSREQTFGPLGTSEDTLAVSQTIDLANRRGLLGEAGRARARAARDEASAELQSMAAAARERFFAALYRRERAEALRRWLARLDEALAIVARRTRGGEAALYDLRRLERERGVAQAQLESELAGLERAQAAVRALLGSPEPAPVLAGTLLPDSDPAELASLRAAAAARADLRALDHRLAAAELEQTAGSRGWIPDLTLQAGWKAIDSGAQGRSDGIVLGASLALPFWDRASGLSQSARGEAQTARSRRALLATALQAELAGARAEAIRRRHAAIQFQERVKSTSSEVVRIASAGYEGGELGLLELLDAYRGAAEDAVTALEMAYDARRARLELDRLTGRGLP